MESTIPGGYNNNCPTAGSEFNGAGGGYEWNGTEQNVAQMWSIDATAHTLKVKLPAPPNGATKTLTYVLMVNGAPTALELTIEDAETTGSVTGGTIDLEPGDWISVRCTAANGPDAVTAAWTLGYDSDNPNESVVLGHCWCRNNVTRYASVCSCAAVDDGTETNARQIMPTDGALSHLYAKASNSPGAGGDTFTITLRELARIGGDTASEVVLTDAETTGNTAASVDMQPGDIVTVCTVPGNSPANTNVRVALGWKFTADINGESIVMGGTSDNLNTGATEFNYLTTGRHTAAWNGTEAQVKQILLVCSAKRIYGKLQNDPSGGTFDLTLNINTGAGNNTVSLTNTTPTATTATDAISDTDDVNVESNPDATPPSGGDIYWGVMLFINPTAAGWTGKIMGVTNPAKIDGVAVAGISKVTGVS